ncbi:MAG: phage holin family protein [Pacificimonas sp.]
MAEDADFVPEPYFTHRTHARHEGSIGELLKRAERDIEATVQSQLAFVRAEARARADMAKPTALWGSIAFTMAWFGIFATVVAIGTGLALLIGVPLAFAATALMLFGVAAFAGLKAKTALQAALELQADRARQRFGDQS